MYVTDDPPLPVIKETCEYDSISDLVIHNISWNMEFIINDVKKYCSLKHGILLEDALTLMEPRQAR